MSLPKKIKPCPIKDALVEIRFVPDISLDAVFGVIYKQLRNDYGEPEQLPIMQMPAEIRNKEKNFRFKPHYKLLKPPYVVQIGPEMIAISSYPDYVGWENFSAEIIKVLEHIEESEVIKEISRVGIRYINFFENDIFKKVRIKILKDDSEINYLNSFFRTEMMDGNFKNKLQIGNNVTVDGKNGSIIDIDTVKDSGLENFFTEKKEIISRGHEVEKKLFFELLTDEFLKSLNPEY